MDLLKLVDMYGRAYYYESLKPAKARMKKFMFEQSQNKLYFSRIPQSHQVVNDEWVSVTLVDEGELREYIDRRTIREEERRRKHEEWCREAYARQEARCKDMVEVMSTSKSQT